MERSGITENSAPHTPESAPAGPVQDSQLLGRETTPTPPQPNPTGQTPTYPEVVQRPVRTRKLPERFKDFELNSVKTKQGRGLKKYKKSK